VRAFAYRHDNDRDDRGWQNINQRQRELDAVSIAGVRDRSLSRREAIASAKNSMRSRVSSAISPQRPVQAERRDLDRRFDRLEL
jgi:hypothetical protein